MILIELLLALLAAFGMAMVLGFWPPRRVGGDRYEAKLAGIGEHAMSLSDIELNQPLSERLLAPIRRRLARMVTSRTPAARQEQLRLLIAAAGRPMNVNLPGLITMKIVCAIAVGLVASFLVLPLFHVAFPVDLFGFAALPLGYILPDRWLKTRADARRRKIERAIPDTIDLLTICIDAGLSLDAGLQRITEKVEEPLKTELAAMLADIRYGRPRDEAMVAMAERLDVEEMTALVNAIVQSQKLGVAVGDTVRIQASEIRRRRRQHAEELASQASLKMLFPMIGCIFPTLFIVLMGPVALLLIGRK